MADKTFSAELTMYELKEAFTASLALSGAAIDRCGLLMNGFYDDEFGDLKEAVQRSVYLFECIEKYRTVNNG